MIATREFESAQRTPKNRVKPIRVLLVEDDEDDFVLTRELLSEIQWQKFDLDWVASYDLGLERIQQNCHDVYLIDYQLGEENGLLLLQKAVEFGVKAPLIMLTGTGDHEIDVEAMRSGAADYLVKGRIDPMSLERSIRYCLEKSRILEALRESEERYALAVRGTNDGLWDWNLKTGRIYFSSRWKALLGYRDHELQNRIEEWFERIHPEDRENAKSVMQAQMEGIARSFKHEYRIQHKDGSYRWVQSRAAVVQDEQGCTARITGSLTDITDRKALEFRLMHEALYDSLTDLPNRALFMDRLGRAIERAKRRGDSKFAVLFFDLDNFKQINDRMGHLMGDQLLIQVRDRVRRCLRRGDTLARFGGDEFTVLLEEVKDPANSNMVAERIQNQLAPPMMLNERKVPVTASIGIVTSEGGTVAPEELLRDADVAMYQAKSAGKGRHVLFQNWMRSQLNSS